MKKDLPEKEESQIEEAPEDNLFSEWSNMDATSIYRAGSESKTPTNQVELNQIVKETKVFFKIAIVMLIIVFIVIFISSYY